MTEKVNIRRHYDVTSQKWYFSIVDVIGALTESTDARNYWKVLKNRLKKRHPDLVTKCNQLKLPAKDGKSYLTDIADYETILDILEHVPQARAEVFKTYCEPILNSPLEGWPQAGVDNSPPPPAGTPQEENVAEAKLLVDAYQTPTHIYIEAFVAGVAPEDIHIYVSEGKVVIMGKRERGVEIGEYLREELLWTTFAREIILPCPVEKDKVKVNEDNGLVIIELQKITN